MRPLVSVVGRSGVGKTTFLEKLIRELKARGYRVAVIKHDPHRFEIDHPGKDSWRLREAGADVIMISSPEKFALVEQVKEERTLHDLIDMIDDRADIVLTEGYSGADTPKIEVSCRACGSHLIADASELLAIVADQPFSLSVPQFDLDGAPAVSDLLESHFGLLPEKARR